MTESTENRIAAVADALLELTYSEMMELAQSLSDIVNDDAEFEIGSRECFSSLLNSWAETYDRSDEASNG